MINLYHTRRTNYKKCYYYKRNENDNVGDMSVWVANKKPTGTFYAKKINAQNKENATFVNAYEIRKQSCTIETNDYVTDIEENDIVMYNGLHWAVTSVQELENLKETEFSNKEYYKTIIGLRR